MALSKEEKTGIMIVGTLMCLALMWLMIFGLFFWLAKSADDGPGRRPSEFERKR
jgi:hypothetical protein